MGIASLAGVPANAAGFVSDPVTASPGATLTGVVISPGSAEFGDVKVGTKSATLSFTATNYTSSTVGYFNLSGSRAFTLQPGTCHRASGEVMLAVGASCTFSASFSPTALGRTTATMNISTSSGPLSFELSGYGVPAVAVLITPSSAVFGNVAVGAESPSLSFTAVNDTNSTVGYINTVGSSEFHLSAGTCHLTSNEIMLAENSSCVFHASFAPAATGAATATLNISTSSGPFSFHLTGSGVTAPPVSKPGGPYVGLAGRSIAFSGSTSTAPSSQTLTGYTWNFGDGTIGTGVTPAHVYSAPGTYNVTLTVKDTSGQTAFATATAKIFNGIQSLTVTPSNFVLDGNSLQGIASQQLKVTGLLTDGTTIIDLTSTAEGTSYSSSDPSICNSGTPDGDVFAGHTGTCAITITSNGFTATAAGVVNTFTPTALSYVDIAYGANAVAVNGNYAYVTALNSGLQVVDISDRKNPSVIFDGSLELPGTAKDVKLLGNFAYLAAGSAGLEVLDITYPFPALRGIFAGTRNALTVTVAGTLAYVSDGSTIAIVDVTNPRKLEQVGSISLNGSLYGTAIDTARNLLVVAAGTSGIYVIDVSRPAAPVLLGTAVTGDARAVAIKGNHVIVADYTNGTTSVNITNPKAPFVASGIPDPNVGGSLQDIVISDSIAFAADARSGTSVPITDSSNPADLVARGILNFPQRDDSGMAIAADGTYVYLATKYDGLQMYGIDTSPRFYIGQYLSLTDNKGVPPTVAIASPKTGATVIAGSTLPIFVNASDDVAVAAVNFLVNGNVVFTCTSPPYQYNYAVPVGETSITIGATAVDLAGNIGTAQPFIGNVIPDPGTTVVGKVVDASNQPVAGIKVTIYGGLISTNTEGDGTFTFNGFSSLSGSIQAIASGTVNGVLLGGSAAAVFPVRGGTTNAGTIVALPLGSRGRDFWIAFPSAQFNPAGQIFILSDTTAHYTLGGSPLSGGGLAVGTASPEAPGLETFGGIEQTGNQTVDSGGFHITSDADISVFVYFEPQTYSSESYLAIPTPSLGTEYFALAYTSNDPYLPSELSITATQDNTSVTITNPCGANSSPQSILINQGERYQLQCPVYSDVSGAHVVSNYPVAVIAAVDCAQIPNGIGGCDFIAEMMFPVGRLWGTEVYSAPLPGAGRDVFRVIAARDGTTVTLYQGGGNIQTFSLNSGEFKEIHFKSGGRFTSNLPILVMQYMTGFGDNGVGDPFSMQLLPVTAFAQSFQLYAPPPEREGLNNQAIIIASDSAVDSVQLNGGLVTGFKALPGGKYKYAEINLPDRLNKITATAPITVYSFGTQPDYAYGSPVQF